MLCIHNDRAVPGDRLADRAAGNKQEPHREIFGSYRDLFAIFKYDQGAVTQPAVVLRIEIIAAFTVVSEWILLVTESSLAIDNVGENGIPGWGGEDKACLGWNGNIQVLRIDDDVLHRSAHPCRPRRR